MKGLLCRVSCKFRQGNVQIKFIKGQLYPVALGDDRRWWMINREVKKKIIVLRKFISQIRKFFSPYKPTNLPKRNRNMSARRWVKCVKTITGTSTRVFIEGKYYQVLDFSDPIIILIDEIGNYIGFDISRDPVFKAHFKQLGVSQKRGTGWDISRRQ